MRGGLTRIRKVGGHIVVEGRRATCFDWTIVGTATTDREAVAIADAHRAEIRCANHNGRRVLKRGR